jgi:hypothetical protein
MSELPDPPAWAETIVTLFAPARRQDSVVGDLLEEYREVQLPRHGVAAANRWFARHALGFLWRVALPWAILFGVISAARDVIDALVPTTDNFHFRSAVSTYLAMGTYATAGLVTGWRCGRIVAGIAVSVFMTAFATVTSLVDAYTINALLSAGVFQPVASYGGLREALDVPVLAMLIIGVPLSLIGAAIGKAGRYMPRVDIT